MESSEPHVVVLSPRETQVLGMAAEGKTDQGIANELGVSLTTVSTYWGRIRAKMGQLNRAELVAKHLKSQARTAIERLREDNRILLEALNREEQAAQDLDSVLQFYRALIESAPDAVIVVNELGEILLSNAQGSDLFGYSKKELQGLNVRDLVPERVRMAHDEKMNEYLEHPDRHHMGGHHQTFALHRLGYYFQVSVSLSAFETGQGTIVTCIVRPVGEENQA